MRFCSWKAKGRKEKRGYIADRRSECIQDRMARQQCKMQRGTVEENKEQGG